MQQEFHEQGERQAKVVSVIEMKDRSLLQGSSTRWCCMSRKRKANNSQWSIGWLKDWCDGSETQRGCQFFTSSLPKPFSSCQEKGWYHVHVCLELFCGELLVRKRELISWDRKQVWEELESTHTKLSVSSYAPVAIPHWYKKIRFQFAR